MAHELYTRTNQKIYFAGLALNAWQHAEAGGAINAQALVQANREAALFHLYGALLGLCHEIAGFYRLQQANASDVDVFLKAEFLDLAPSPELAELVETRQQRESWLAELIENYKALSLPPSAPKKAKTDVRLPLIVGIELSDEVIPVGHAELESWRQSLKLLAIRFREGLSEC